jgi:hypothetical protein
VTGHAMMCWVRVTKKSGGGAGAGEIKTGYSFTAEWRLSFPTHITRYARLRCAGGVACQSPRKKEAPTKLRRCILANSCPAYTYVCMGMGVGSICCCGVERGISAHLDLEVRAVLGWGHGQARPLRLLEHGDEVAAVKQRY